MLIVVQHGHPVLVPDSTEAGQLRGEILADLDGARNQHGAKTGGIVDEQLARGSRRKMAYFTRSRVVET